MQGLQILAGKYKGLKVYTDSKLSYRPTQSRVRKSLFDHLGDLSGLEIADLFAGTGILGFEAASRGADVVHLVEKDHKTITHLEKNMERIQISEINVVKSDVFRFLKQNKKFNIILADPPYKWYSVEKEENKIDSLIKNCMDCLAEKGLFVLEAPSKIPLNGTYEKKYGDTKLYFWRK